MTCDLHLVEYCDVLNLHVHGSWMVEVEGKTEEKWTVVLTGVYMDPLLRTLRSEC